RSATAGSPGRTRTPWTRRSTTARTARAQPATARPATASPATASPATARPSRARPRSARRRSARRRSTRPRSTRRPADARPADAPAARQRTGGSADQPGQLHARADPEPGEDVAEVVVDGPRAEQEARCGPAARPGPEGRPRAARQGRFGDGEGRDGLPGGAQLGAGPRRPRDGVVPLEDPQRGAQVLAGGAGAAAAAEPVPEQQFRPG